NPKERVRIALVGKYTDSRESYKSLHEALVHAAASHQVGLDIEYIDASELEKPRFKELERRAELLGNADGILVPGGFGVRGVEGKIRAIEYARTQGKPFFGICLGMQLMAVEFARHVCKLSEAHSGEFVKDPSKNKQLVINY